MAVITRWFVTTADKQTHGPYDTEQEAYSTITLTEEEQMAQNRVHQKHAHVWKQTLAVSDAGEHELYNPPPPKVLYYARIPDPTQLLPFAGAHSEVSPEAAIKLLKKIVTWNGQRPFPADVDVEVHTYSLLLDAMVVVSAEEECE